MELTLNAWQLPPTLVFRVFRAMPFAMAHQITKISANVLESPNIRSSSVFLAALEIIGIAGIQNIETTLFFSPFIRKWARQHSDPKVRNLAVTIRGAWNDVRNNYFPSSLKDSWPRPFDQIGNDLPLSQTRPDKLVQEHAYRRLIENRATRYSRLQQLSTDL